MEEFTNNKERYVSMFFKGQIAIKTESGESLNECLAILRRLSSVGINNVNGIYDYYSYNAPSGRLLGQDHTPTDKEILKSKVLIRILNAENYTKEENRESLIDMFFKKELVIRNNDGKELKKCMDLLNNTHRGMSVILISNSTYYSYDNSRGSGLRSSITVLSQEKVINASKFAYILREKKEEDSIDDIKFRFGDTFTRSGNEFIGRWTVIRVNKEIRHIEIIGYSTAHAREAKFMVTFEDAKDFINRGEWKNYHARSFAYEFKNGDTFSRKNRVGCLTIVHSDSTSVSILLDGMHSVDMPLEQAKEQIENGDWILQSQTETVKKTEENAERNEQEGKQRNLQTSNELGERQDGGKRNRLISSKSRKAIKGRPLCSGRSIGRSTNSIGRGRIQEGKRI